MIDVFMAKAQFIFYLHDAPSLKAGVTLILSRRKMSLSKNLSSLRDRIFHSSLYLTIITFSTLCSLAECTSKKYIPSGSVDVEIETEEVEDEAPEQSVTPAIDFNAQI
jgi:hypothetical protein